MMRAFLITRPNFDFATNYLFYWSKYVIDEADKRGVKLLDLAYEKADRKTFESYCTKQKPRLIFFNGHGSSNTIKGHDNEILVKAGDNEKILLNKIIYARSCDAAKKLGPKCIKSGTETFIGYTDEFVLVFSQKKASRPLKDSLAALFLEPSNLIPISILKGNTAIKAYNKSQAAMKRNLQYMLSSKASQLERDAAPYLWTNKQCQTILGNHSARF